MRLATNVSDNNLSFGEKENSRGSGSEATYGIIESVMNFMNKDNVKSIDDDGRCLEKGPSTTG